MKLIQLAAITSFLISFSLFYGEVKCQDAPVDDEEEEVNDPNVGVDMFGNPV